MARACTHLSPEFNATIMGRSHVRAAVFAVLGCIAVLCGVGPSQADTLADCNQLRDQQLRLEACSEIIADAVYGVNEKAISYRNRGNAGAEAETPRATPVADAADVGDAQRGGAYARKHCSTCHNVSKGDAPSPNRQAPPFARIASTPGMSVTALTVWSRTMHASMPNLVIEPDDMDDIIAYILSLRDR